MSVQKIARFAKPQQKSVSQESPVGRFFVFFNLKKNAQVPWFNSHKKGNEPHPGLLHCGFFLSEAAQVSPLGGEVGHMPAQLPLRWVKTLEPWVLNAFLVRSERKFAQTKFANALISKFRLSSNGGHVNIS